MLTHQQGQGFNSMENLEGIERRDTGAEVQKETDPRLQNISQTWGRCFFVSTEGLPERKAVVRRVRLGYLREVAVGPIKGAAVHNGAADAGAVPAQELGQLIDYYVCAHLKRFQERRR